MHCERWKMNFQVIFQLNGAECWSLNFPIKGTAWNNRQDINNYVACYQVQYDCLQLCRSDHPEISLHFEWNISVMQVDFNLNLLKLLQSFILSQAWDSLNTSSPKRSLNAQMQFLTAEPKAIKYNKMWSWPKPVTVFTSPNYWQVSTLEVFGSYFDAC